jgi:hypothetical protein
VKLIVKAGDTSNIWQIFIADSSSTTGAGLAGLTNASSGLTAYYHRDNDTTATAISLVSMTVGTFTSGGFKEIDATNMPGWYQFCPPDAAVAASAKSCAFHLKGVTNMAPLPIEVELVAVNLQDTVRMGMTALPNAAAEAAGGLFTRGTGAGQINQAANGQVDVNAVKMSGTSLTGRDIGASVLLSSGTGTGQLDFTSGIVKANLMQLFGTVLTEGASGRLAGGFVQFFNVAGPTSTMNEVSAVSEVTSLLNSPLFGDFTSTMKASLNAATPAVTVSDKTGFSLVAGYDPAKTAAQAGDAMALTSGERTTLAAAIWNALTSGLTTVASIGKLLVDNLNATISSRLASASYTAPDNAGIASAAAAAASAATDSATLVGRLTSGRATNLDNLDAAVSTRTKPSDTQAAVTTAINLTNAPTAGDFTAAMKISLNAATPAATVSDKTGFSLVAGYDPAKTAAQAGDAMALTSGERTTLAAAIWNALTSGLTTVASIGKLLVDNVNATISSRLASASYTAPDNAGIASAAAAAASAAIASAAIKLKTDNLPGAPAAVGSAMTLTGGERDSIAAALLNLADGIETGYTVKQTLRLELAVLAGKISGAPSSPILIRDVNDSKNRVTAAVDADGNRTAVTLDVS